MSSRGGPGRNSASARSIAVAIASAEPPGIVASRVIRRPIPNSSRSAERVSVTPSL